MESENLGLIFCTKLNKDSFSFLTINPSISQSPSYQQDLNQSLTNQSITAGLIFQVLSHPSIHRRYLIYQSIHYPFIHRSIQTSIKEAKYKSTPFSDNKQKSSNLFNDRNFLKIAFWAPKPGRGAPEGSHSRCLSTKAHGYITRNKLL